jgi:hypothetical protein
MADRVRAVWHERLIVIATGLPVDIDVDLLITQGELMRAVREAARIKAALAEKGWWVAAEAARNGREGIRRTTDQTVIDLFLRFCLSFGEFDCLLPAGRNLVPARLRTVLPVIDALRLANEVHRGLRLVPPRGGILRACLRRHGLVPSWVDLPALVPELVPTAAVAEIIKDSELPIAAELKGELASATYRVAGRRGRPGVVMWDTARVAVPAAVLSRLLRVRVEVEGTDPPPSVVVPMTRVAYADAVCVQCRDPASPVAVGSALCDVCAYLQGTGSTDCPAWLRQKGVRPW